MCSGVFVSGRKEVDIERNDFSFPFNLVSYKINIGDSSVSTSLLGFAKNKAIYRYGLGATLINGLSEKELRSQQIAIAAPKAINQDTIDWPMGNRLKNMITTGFNKQLLDKTVEEAFYDANTKATRGTRALLVVYKGEIIAEKYADGFTAGTRQLGWSMTKGMMNALLGILVKQGKINIAEQAPIAEWKNDNRKAITIANLMHMNSGLKYSWFPAGPSDLTTMLFKEKNMGEYALHSPLIHTPGTVFNYSDGTANILSLMMRRMLGDKDYYRFIDEQLFYKIGMLSALIEPDAGGTLVGSSYCYATARDWARFGLLYMNDGVFNGERILPQGWVNFTVTPDSANNKDGRGLYGALWWINAPYNKSNPANRKYPQVPADCFSCQGYDGQFVWVIPSKKLVVVRLGLDSGSYLDPGSFLGDLMKAF